MIDQKQVKEMPKLGFGLMRLPMKGDVIDIEQTKAMVDAFMSAGFVYFDTAYGYGDGASEMAAKEALVDRYPRDSFILATKLPAWLGAKSAEEAKAMFDISLARTGAGYFDYYLLHNLGEKRTHYFDDFGIWDFLQEKKKAGLIRHLGFSFHDKAAVLDEILTAHPEMEFVQLQINYGDWDNPAVESRLCYEVARKHGKPIIIMEPVKGGMLASPPPAVEALFKEFNPAVSISSWAIRFAASLEGIITVLSGMSDMAQMEDNLATMKGFSPLSDEERKIVEMAQEIILSADTIPCTGCGYCMKGCPKNIAIYGILNALNVESQYKNMRAAKGRFDWVTKGLSQAPASACIGCGACERVCPQHIDIIRRLKQAKAMFEPAKA